MSTSLKPLPYGDCPRSSLTSSSDPHHRVRVEDPKVYESTQSWVQWRRKRFVYCVLNIYKQTIYK